MPTVLIPSLIFIPLCVLLRRPRATLIHLPVFAVFLLWYGVLFVPRMPENLPDNAPRFTLLSYNLYASNRDHNAVIERIRSADADLVALQELTVSTADALIAELSAEYPHQAFHPVGETVVGQGFMSRYPIMEDEYFESGLGQQRVLIQIGNHQVTVFNVHPPPPSTLGADFRGRTDAISEILQRAIPTEGLVILAGDFNMTDASNDYARVDQHYDDAFRQVGMGLGYSFPDLSRRNSWMRVIPPIIRIDYIFYTPGLRPINAWVSHTSGGSDHRPTFAEFVITAVK
jgi:vancomycin resistance protein VanJ